MSTERRMDDDFDRALVQALRDEAYSIPLQLTGAVLKGRTRHPPSALVTHVRSLLAAALVVGAIVLAVVALPRLPAFLAPAATDTCQVSPVTRHGTWWQEIGGEGAFFNADPTAMYAGDEHTWLIHIRFHPAPGTLDTVSMHAERVDGTGRADARLNGPADPSNIYRGDVRAPDLPGGWYLFEQPFPTGGCWRLVADIDGQVVGTAVVEVEGAPATSPTPDSIGPTPRLAPETPSPAAEPGPLAGAWVLEGGIVDGRPIPLVDGYRVTLSFAGDQIQGTSACNGYGAPFLAGGGSFRIGPAGVPPVGADGEEEVVLWS